MFTVGVSVLKEVVANVLVGKRLEGFGDVYPVIVDALRGDVLLWVLASLVRMQREREFAVVPLDFLLICALSCELVWSSRKQIVTTRTLSP